MYVNQAMEDALRSVDEEASEMPSTEVDPEWCHDRAKPRASVEQYTSLVGVMVARNLEGIARARSDKRQRQYQSDATVHQAYIQATTGGGGREDGDEGLEAEPSDEAPQKAKAFFEPLPWGITSQEGNGEIFGFRPPLTAHALR